MKIDVDALAQEIRRVDGDHSLGAGALAEALAPYIAALSPPALEGMPDPIAYTRDNGPGKVVGLEWNPCYPVHTLRGRIALYASPVAAQAVTDRQLAAAIALAEEWDADARAEGFGGGSVRAREMLDAIAKAAHPNAAPNDAQGVSNG